MKWIVFKEITMDNISNITNTNPGQKTRSGSITDAQAKSPEKDNDVKSLPSTNTETESISATAETNIIVPADQKQDVASELHNGAVAPQSVESGQDSH